MAWEVAVRGRTYEKIYRRNCNLLYTAFYVLHFAAVCGTYRWYGDGRFNSVRDPDPVHLGMVVLILFATLILSILLSSISKNRIKYLYPAAAAAAFLPSVFLHYNGTAFVHAVWCFVVAVVGMLLGTIIFKALHRKS